MEALRARGYFVLYGMASGPAPDYDPQKLQAKSLYLTRPGLPQYIATREELEQRAGDVLRLGRRRLARRAHRRPLRARRGPAGPRGPRGAPQHRKAAADPVTVYQRAASVALFGCMTTSHPILGHGTFARHG